MASNVWFIAGASCGFGRAICLEALKRGDKVVATSRNLSKMADLEEAGALVLALDVTSDDTTIQAAFQKAIDTYGKITHCINPVGYILEGSAEEASTQEVFNQFNTNVLGVMKITRHALYHMRPRRQGVIANFGSLVNWQGIPGAIYYSSTKSAVTGFTETMHREVSPFGISAVIIEPGFFRTEIFEDGGSNRIRVAKPLTDEYKNTPVDETRNHFNILHKHQPGDVVKGAKVIVDVLTQTGVAEGKKIPPRLVLGRDTFEAIKDKIHSIEVLIKEWEDIIVSTDHDDIKK
ncbi:putative oxidoreductase YusZ [Daldinia childiae]|uniref:putative oxidoreductase YusZ n=1 Tax=Daldinia childiae TaxID=326645 RepID=UPI0014482F32|nr:putative oxidoreductase YusZ [Daldinia childiae]KAF3064798.1 putative oxidoreductase YusZ [Daldinia childiae]